MATDVDVQYFSHLNGLTLGNNWGDLIRLLDKALVTGIDFTQITAASIDAQGDVHITLYAAHNAMLFQVVELSGFSPASLNQKYRIKGVLSPTELILKPHTAITETSITTVGAGKLASLGYEIIFRDTNDVKRVYRAKNPRSEHPFIRVDESLTSPDGTTGVYTPTYAKYAMVGLLEHMEHIDDFENPDVLQLPFDPADPAKNWRINGTGTAVKRGWGRWYWARGMDYEPNFSANGKDSIQPGGGIRNFTLAGNSDAFYLLHNARSVGWNHYKTLMGLGMYNSAGGASNWFYMGLLTLKDANSNPTNAYNENTPLMTKDSVGYFYTTQSSHGIHSHVIATPIVHDYLSGYSNVFSSSYLPALEIPFFDANKELRGTLKHILYAGKSINTSASTPVISDSSMYVQDSAFVYQGGERRGGFVFYLGELE